jgi:hypothetical protein
LAISKSLARKIILHIRLSQCQKRKDEASVLLEQVAEMFEAAVVCLFNVAGKVRVASLSVCATPFLRA